MTSTDSLKSAKAPADFGREMRSGGASLFIGAVIFVITIGLEQRIGWPPPDAADIAEVLHQLWSSLRWLWAVQLIAGFLFGLSALLILRSPYLETRWIAATLIWSAVAIGAIILTVAYGLALGGYPSALDALERNPDILETFRGGIRFLFMSALAVVVLAYHALFIGEGFVKSGVVPRYWLIGAIVVIALAMIASAAGLPAAGVVAFFAPALLGLALWRAGWTFDHGTSGLRDSSSTAQDYIDEANAIVPRVTTEEGIEIHSRRKAVFIDVRDSNSLRSTGTIAGAHHVPRGMLELSADPESKFHKPFFEKEAQICVVCGAGLMAAMAGKTLIDMGYENVINVGGTQAWIDAGGPVEPVNS